MLPASVVIRCDKPCVAVRQIDDLERSFAPHFGNEVVVVAVTVGVGEFNRQAGFQIADAGDEQNRLAYRNTQLIGEPRLAN